MKTTGWYAIALERLQELAHRKRFITVDDLHDEIDADYPAPTPNAYGAVMHEAINRRILCSTTSTVASRQPNRRGGRILVHETLSQFCTDSESLDDYMRRRESEADARLKLEL
jgi:hypothetical protein